MAGDMEQQRTANVVLTADVDPYRQSIRAAGEETNRLSLSIDKVGQSLSNLSKSAGKKLTFFGVGSLAGITGTTAAFASFDKQMTALKVNSAVTGRSYDKMTRSVNTLRKEFGIATSTAVELNRSILGFKDGSAPVEKLAETFVRLGAVAGEAPESMARGMLQLQRSMGTSQKDTARYANVLADLSVKSGVAASSIMEFSQVIAPIGRIAGMKQEEIMGISTAFNKAGQDGFMAANAFNKMLSDIMRSTQNGSPDLAKYSNLIGVTVAQFKDMDKTDAMTRIFDELNRLGPNAIQILNRMGLDGMRMQRAIAGVSQQSGGIGTAVAQAVSAYSAGGDNALKKGSEVALDGVADKMSRLAESTKQMGEAMGSAFSGPAKIFLTAMQQIVNMMGMITGSTGGKVILWLSGLAAVAALAAGPLLKLAGGLATLATVRGLTTNWMTAGYKDRIAERDGTGRMTETGRQFNTPGATNVFQRGAYRIGHDRLGAIGPTHPLRTMGAFAGRATAVGADFMRGIYAPLVHPWNSAARPRIFATDNERAAGMGYGPRGMFSGSVAAGTAGGVGPPPPGSGMLARSMWIGGNLGSSAMNAAGRGIGRMAPTPAFLSGPGREWANAGARVGGLVGTLGGAAAGTTAIAGSMLGRAGMGLAGGLARSVGSLGPMGLGMIGIPLAMMMKSGMDSRNKLDVGAGADNLSLFDSYKAAVGEATSATLDFATALRNSAPKTPETKEEAMRISESDRALVLSTKDELTDPRLKNVSFPQAVNLLRGQIKSGASPEVITEMKQDLMRVFGETKAAKALTEASGPGSFSVDSFVKELGKYSGNSGADWFGLRAGKEVGDQYKLLDGQMKAMFNNSIAVGDSKAGREAQKVLTNQFLSSFYGDYGNLSGGEVDAGHEFINKNLMGGKVDIGDEGGANKDPLSLAGGLVNKALDWQQFAIDSSKVEAAFKKSKTAGLQNFYGQMAESDHKGTAQAYERVIAGAGLTRDQAQEQIDTGKGSLFRTDMSVAKSLMSKTESAAEEFRNRIYSTEAGQIFKDDPKAMRAINTAIKAPGDQNLQIQAMDQMVLSLKKSGASFADIDRMLLLFQGALQDTTDPLYQLAVSAGAVAQQNLQYKLPYMGTSQQFASMSLGYVGKMDALTPKEGVTLPGDAAVKRKEAKSSFENYKLGVRNQVMALYTQQREFDISRERSNDDFYGVQLPRMEAQYSLSRTRSWEDYNISRTRSEEQFALSQQRGAQQYKISLKDSYFDFHLSRNRAEKDFAHQQVLLAKQAAQGMYNVYQRVMVQRTWSAPSLLMNSDDQLDKMRQQNQDLRKVRKMGLSRTAVQQLGFTDAANQQQLARFIEDAMRNPALVAKFNRNAANRLSAGKKLATDPDNPQWQEMRRQFSLTMDRGADDFKRAMGRNRRNYQISMSQAQADFGRAMRHNATDMKRAMSRSAADYNLSISQMTDDYEKQQDRAAADLKRMQRELTWSFAKTLRKASGSLSGYAKDMVDQMIADWNRLKAALQNTKVEVKVNWKLYPGLEPLKGTQDPDRNPKRTNAYGGVYSGSQDLTVGEKNAELVLPLNGQGADFIATLLHRFSNDAQKMRVSGNSLPVGSSSVYNYRVDSSTNFTGPVQVSGVENPRELAEKARMEARRRKLTAGVRK